MTGDMRLIDTNVLGRGSGAWHNNLINLEIRSSIID
jgi:hypothetical protein